MTDLPILYSFRRCPYAMRARLALLLGEITCEIREVVLRDKPAEMIALSPKATVPVLALPDGRIIDQSLDIMCWALPLSTLGEEDAALIAANDGPFKRHLDRYKYPDRHDGDHLIDRAAAMDILAGYEERLQCHACLQGDRLSLADFAIMPFVRQFAAVDQAWFDAQPLPKLEQWLASLITSPLFERAMVRLPAWRPGDQATLFPTPA